MVKRSSMVDSLFKDESGEIVIAQFPNLPILLWALTTLLTRFLFEKGTLHTSLSYAGFGLLFTWCWLEIFQGVNYFRRALGLTVLVYLLVSRM